jgi:hypothetical protein
MGFRQDNKRKREQQSAYQSWLAANSVLIDESGLPTTVTQSRDDWAYFLQFRYHDHGNWNTPPFTCIDFIWDDLPSERQKIVQALETNWKQWLDRYPILAKRLSAQKAL